MGLLNYTTSIDAGKTVGEIQTVRYSERMRHIIPISGKDSLATAIWQTTHHPELNYEFVFNDTRAELPETYEWLARVESVLGIRIERIGKNLEAIIDEQAILPSPRIRFCTERAKIRPMDRFIGAETAIVYFGLRADEPDRVGAFKTKKLTPCYPLREAGIGLATVYRIVQGRDLMPPSFFWQRLYDAVAKQMGEAMAIQGDLFQAALDEMDMAGTSCGLLCGK